MGMVTTISSIRTRAARLNKRRRQINKSLNERFKDMQILRTENKLTFEQIAEIYGLTHQRVQAIFKGIKR